jgi:hypothetical protein
MTPTIATDGARLTPGRSRVLHDQRLLHRSLGVGVVVGLAAHVGGYLPGSSVTSEPLGRVGFVQLVPEVKRRQFRQVLEAYEAAQRDAARAGGDQAAGDDAAPTAT